MRKLQGKICPHIAVIRAVPEIQGLVRITVKIIELAPGLALIQGETPSRGAQAAHPRRTREPETRAKVVELAQHRFVVAVRP